MLIPQFNDYLDTVCPKLFPLHIFERWFKIPQEYICIIKHKFCKIVNMDSFVIIILPFVEYIRKNCQAELKAMFFSVT